MLEKYTFACFIVLLNLSFYARGVDPLSAVYFPAIIFWGFVGLIPLGFANHYLKKYFFPSKNEMDKETEEIDLSMATDTCAK